MSPPTRSPAPAGAGDHHGEVTAAAVAGAHRLTTYIRVSTYVMTPMLGALLAMPLTDQATDLRWGLETAAAGLLGYLALATWTTVVITRYVGRGELPMGWRHPLLLALYGAIPAVIVLLTAVLGRRSLVMVTVIVLAMAIVAVAPSMTWRAYALACGWATVLAVACSVVVNVLDGTSVAVGLLATVLLLGWLLLLTLASWLNGWMLRVVLELERAREQAAALAIAQERLRINQDLHDVFGRTLASVAVKSELTAQLIAKGHLEQAETEARAVRVIAEEAGAQVRSVVSGDRRAEVTRELEGSRALLASAGIDCRVLLEVAPATLAPDLREAYGWVVREAVTNVIRHSQATWCRIRLHPGGVRVENDGVSTDPDGTGTGLRGMATRVRAVGAGVRGRREGDRYLLDVTLDP